MKWIKQATAPKFKVPKDAGWEIAATPNVPTPEPGDFPFAFALQIMSAHGLAFKVLDQSLNASPDALPIFRLELETVLTPGDGKIVHSLVDWVLSNGKEV